MAEENGNPTWMVVVEWAFVGFGVIVFAWGLFVLKMAVESRHWATTEGEVVLSKVYVRSTGHTPGHYDRRISPRVKYRYTVDEVQYESEGIAVGGSQTWGIDPLDQVLYTVGYYDKMVGRYPEGRKVTVYYDPRRPQRAALEAGLTAWSFATVVMGIGAVIGGLMALKILPTPFWSEDE